MSKISKAIELYNRNSNLGKKAIIEKMVGELNFSRPMAHSYYKKIVSDNPHQASNNLIANAVKNNAELREMVTARPVRRIASQVNKPLHEFFDLKLMEFSEADTPAFLKK